jgi:hypothetical protein
MREGRLFWVLPVVALIVVAYQSIDRGVDPVATVIIVMLSIPFGLGLAWIKKKLGLIK